MDLRRIGFGLFAISVFWTTSALAQNPASPSTTSPTSATPTATTPSAKPNGGANAGQIGPGVIIPAELSKSVDAKKAKPGDKVEAKTTMDLLSHGQVVIPRDTKVLGHVTAAKPHSKESPESSVGLLFDRIAMKDGHEVPIRSSVQAIGRSLNSFSGASGGAPGTAPPDMPSTTGGMDARGSMSGSSRPNGTPSYPSSSPGSQMPTGSVPSASPGNGVLDPHSQGVVGMKGLQLNSSADASVVSSASNNVHLDSGTQLVLRTE